MKKKRLNIGVLAADRLFDEYSVKIVNSIFKSAEVLDVNVFCFVSRNIQTQIQSMDTIPYDYNQGKELFDIINSKQLDGIIVLAGCICNYTEVKNLEEILKKFIIPIVSVGIEIRNAYNVLVDNYNGMKKLITHFIKDHKFKRVAFIRGPKTNPEAEERYRAYIDTLAEFNIPFDEKLVVEGTFLITPVINEISMLLEKNKDEFDAVIACNDVIAARALAGLKSAGYKVPENVAIGSFDDSDEAGKLVFPVTAVSQPLFSLGKKALKMLLSIINKEDVPKNIILPTSLIIGRSCGCFSFPNAVLIDETGNNDIKNITEVKKNILKKQDFLENIISDNLFMINDNKLINKWASGLLGLLSDLNVNKSCKEFYLYLEKIIVQSLNYTNDIFYWTNIISGLFKSIIAEIPDSKLIEYFTNININSLFIIENYIKQTIKSLKIDHRNKYIDYYAISNAFISASTREDIVTIITQRFPRHNINSCYIYHYLDIIKKDMVRLICGYYKKNDELKIINNDEINDTLSIIPGKVCVDNTRKSFIIIPLFDNDINTGFIIYETEKLDEVLFEILSVQISNVIKSVNLLEKIQIHSKTLEEKVRERTYKLQKAKEENERKLNYFINISHEIKTPLTLIENYFNKYLKENNNKDKDLLVIKKNVDILCNDIINILDIEKVMKNHNSYADEKLIDFSSFTIVKINLFKEIAANKNIKINTKIQKDIRIKIDPYSLDRILNNLIDNAIKYNKENGSINIELEMLDKKIYFSISDTGIGMNKIQLKNLFADFDKKTNSGFSKKGFGLNIVKMIIDDLNEEIEIKSRENQGTEIKIVFSKHFIETNSKYTTETMNDSLYNEMNDYLLLDSEYDESRSNILVVEDNHYMLYYLQDVLTSKYNFYYAKNGKQALLKLEDIVKPDIIISDIMMEEMDGVEFFENLSTDLRFKDIPLIFLTAKSTREEKIKGLKKGAVDYIYKPFNIDELSAKIDSILKNRSTLKRANENDFINKIKNVIETSPVKSEGKISLTEKSLRHGISKKEHDVLELLVQGKEYKEISLDLDVPLNTIKARVHNIYQKFNVNNKIELINLVNK